jgi:23S rRNA-/tRNA-specific pseudouridylate synthase
MEERLAAAGGEASASVSMNLRATALPPCVVFEDDDLLVVNKPPGWNTHAPSPYAGEGVYDWLRHREPRWAELAILHRLDKETSGLMVFGKTPLANRSLTQQFEERRVEKVYRLRTDRPIQAAVASRTPIPKSRAPAA